MLMVCYQRLPCVKVFGELFVVDEQLDEQPGPPLPPETLRFHGIGGCAADPDYPPSTWYVRVVRIGGRCTGLEALLFRGQGRAGTGRSPVLWDFGSTVLGGNS